VPAHDPPALLFFAFHALTAEPDRILAERGLGRVHHRILYFVGRTPGVRVGGLLATLGVSKQALNRPLNELLRQGLVATRVPPENRRAKELRLTGAGARLERSLTASQRRRFRRAFESAPPAAEAGWRAVMELLAGASVPPLGLRRTGSRASPRGGSGGSPRRVARPR
jgi:DNA-binding MarR family transcriptional regulator